MEVKVSIGYGIIWLLIAEWIIQRCNQSHAKKRENKFTEANVARTVRFGYTSISTAKCSNALQSH
jgi:hypothetical protein